MHRLFRNVARIAAFTVVIVGGGAVAAIPPAMADIGADMRLVCSGKSGTYKVGLRVETTAPSSGTVGQPIQLGTVKIDVGVPAELVTKVQADSPGGPSATPVTGVASSPTDPPALSGVAEIGVAIRESDRVQDGGWPVFALAGAPSRGDEIVHLTGSGVAPPVTPQSAGEMSWTAGALNLSLVPADTTEGSNTSGTALRCSAEKDIRLGTVPVSRGNEASTHASLSAPSPQPAETEQELCRVIPEPGVDPRYAINPDTKLMEIFDNPSVPSSIPMVPGIGTQFCVKAAGVMNVKKAGNAVPVSLESSLKMATEKYSGNPVLGPNLREQRGYFVSGTHPTPGTVLGFGFMPTRAVAEAVQVGGPEGKETDLVTGNVRLIQRSFENNRQPSIGPDQIRISSYVRIKANQAQVNGVSIDLGNKCMTSATSFTAAASLGNWRTGMLAYDQGQTVVVDDLKIPSFSGCGVTEDLSPILTASVSGSGNYAKAETGTWCAVVAGTNCINGGAPPPPTFTVLPGGEATAIAHPFVLARPTSIAEPIEAQFKCESAKMRFQFKREHWQSRFMLAEGGMSLDGCKVKAADGVEYPVVEVAQEGSLWLSNYLFRENPPDLRITGVMLNAGVDTDNNGTADCRIHINRPRAYSILDTKKAGTPGWIQGAYSNGALSMQYNDLEVAPESTCDIPGFKVSTPSATVAFVHDRDPSETRFVFSPVQTIIWDSRY
jgi:hypothetical protein